MLTWLGSIAAVLILLVGVGIWRLMQGPVELDWALPYVQAGFARAGLGMDVTMSGVRLGIDRGTRQLDLRVEDVHLSLPNGERLASFPEMATSFSLGSLIRGRLAPTQLIVERPVVALSRDVSGSIRFRIGDDAAASGLDIAMSVIGPAVADAPMGQLTRVRIRDATVVVDDQVVGRRWRAGHLDAAITRDGAGSAGDFSVAVTLGAETSELHATYRYAASRRKLDLGLSADRVQPAALAELLPTLAPLSNIHVPISGTAQTQFDVDETKFEGLRVDLAFGAGWLHNAQFPGGRLAVGGGELHAVYAPEAQSVRLDRLTVDLGGGANAVIDGHVDGITRGFVAAGGDTAAVLPAHFGLTLTNLPIARVGALWPAALSPGGRRWVLDNVRDGVLAEASARVDLKLDPQHGAADIGAVHGKLRYHDISVNYFNGLPILQGMSGTAILSDKELDFIPGSGTVKGMKLTGGAVKITNLDQHDQNAVIDATISGPLRDALEILDAKPLRYAHAAGLDPAGVGGKADAQLHFKFPLVDALKLDDVDYTAKATLTGASLAKVALGRNLGDGDLSLDLTRDGVRIKGDARFDGIPAAVDADLAFHPKSGPHAIYRASLTLDDAARQRLDGDFLPERLSGPVTVDLTYTVRDAGHGSAALVADLRAAHLSVAEAAFEKPEGQAGVARIDFDLQHDAIAGPLKVAVAAHGLDGHFVIGLSPDRGQTARIDITHLTVGDDDFTGSLIRRGAGWHADINGKRVDLHPLLKHALAGDKGSPGPPLSVTARIDRVALGPNRVMQGVSAELSRAGGSWQTMRVDGVFANGRRLAVRLGGEAGPHRLSIGSDDLGAALKLFDVANNVNGGKMQVIGELADDGGKPALRAQITGSDFSVSRTGVLTRVLSVASYTGISSIMSGSGIPFGSLQGAFTYTDDRVVLDRLLASGESLGISASGSVDLVHDTLDLTGAIAPANLVNSALGKVPVIGSLLMGGEGQSLFAANYELTGSVDDPGVSVNPLSAVAPGVLRRLFAVPDFSGGEMPPQPEPH
ncbi:MAG TPA: AsmA-like C-terminal domain-containing protein [Stellaceae bacterium]|nr:AsmA-like C-terminal domain-containing protein [Stellaceae bacterium]